MMVDTVLSQPQVRNTIAVLPSLFEPISVGTEASVLVVEDEGSIRQLLGVLLKGEGYRVMLAADAQEARQCLFGQEAALILCDVHLPGESGLDLLRELQRTSPSTAALLMSGSDEKKLATMVSDHGAFGYIAKPFGMKEVVTGVAAALRRRSRELENRQFQTQLEQRMMDHTTVLREAAKNLGWAREELSPAELETVRGLGMAAGSGNHAMARHVVHVSRYCEYLAGRLDLDPRRCNLIRIASSLHDIGKIGTPDKVLSKPEHFSPDDFQVMKQHPEIGHRILEGSDSPLFQLASSIAWTHHERFDGSGYPRGLAGDAIPLEGRIVAIADVFDALTSRRPYKSPFSTERAIEFLREGRGSHFDPDLLDLFIHSIDGVLAIKDQSLDH